MGFFSDLKEDLSQAVNELTPEEQAQQDLANQGEQQAAPETAEDLSKMLDGMDLDNLMGAQEEKQEEEPQTEAPAETEEAAVAQEAVEEKPVEEKTVEKKQDKQHFGSTIPVRQIAEETAIITKGMTVKGDISSEGSLDVVGGVTGNIDILGKLNVTGSIEGNSKAAEFYAEGARINGEVHSSGSLKIGQNSIIIGNIYGFSAVIAGAVKGDIDVNGPVILDASAIVMGNIKSKSVQINNGAVIEGLCSQSYAEVNPTSFFDGLKKNKK